MYRTFLQKVMSMNDALFIRGVCICTHCARVGDWLNPRKWRRKVVREDGGNEAEFLVIYTRSVHKVSNDGV